MLIEWTNQSAMQITLRNLSLFVFSFLFFTNHLQQHGGDVAADDSFNDVTIYEEGVTARIVCNETAPKQFFPNNSEPVAWILPVSDNRILKHLRHFYAGDLQFKLPC